MAFDNLPSPLLVRSLVELQHVHGRFQILIRRRARHIQGSLKAQRRRLGVAQLRIQPAQLQQNLTVGHRHHRFRDVMIHQPESVQRLLFMCELLEVVTPLVFRDPAVFLKWLAHMVVVILVHQLQESAPVVLEQLQDVREQVYVRVIQVPVVLGVVVEQVFAKLFFVDGDPADALRLQLERQPFHRQVGTQAQLVGRGNRDREIDRLLPPVLLNDVQDHDILHLQEVVLARLVAFVERNIQRGRDIPLDRAAVGNRHLHRLLAVGEVTELRGGAGHRGQHVVNEIVRQRDRYFWLFVTKLLDVPVGIEQAEVDHAHVGPDAFHHLQVPEREGVVVAVGEDDAVGFASGQHVVGIIPRDEIAAAVMGMVALRAHVDGYDQ